jgi:hypothetical protein
MKSYSLECTGFGIHLAPCIALRSKLPAHCTEIRRRTFCGAVRSFDIGIARRAPSPVRCCHGVSNRSSVLPGASIRERRCSLPGRCGKQRRRVGAWGCASFPPASAAINASGATPHSRRPMRRQRCRAPLSNATALRATHPVRRFTPGPMLRPTASRGAINASGATPHSRRPMRRQRCRAPLSNATALRATHPVRRFTRAEPVLPPTVSRGAALRGVSKRGA